MNLTNSLDQITYLLQQQKYQEVQFLCENIIDNFPEARRFYWYLGLVLLLQEREEEAQSIWVSLFLNAEDDEAEIWTSELVEILEAEIKRQELFNQVYNIWLIRQYIREFAPDNIDNIFELTKLTINDGFNHNNLAGLIQEIIDFSDLEEIGIDDFIESVFSIITILDQEEIIDQLLQHLLDLSLQNQLVKNKFIQQLIATLENNNCFKNTLIKIGLTLLSFNPHNKAVILRLISLYQDVEKYQEADRLGNYLLTILDDILDRIATYFMMFRTWLKQGGNFTTFQAIYQEYQQLILEVIEQNIDLNQNHLLNFVAVTSYSAYLRDNPSEDQPFRHQVSAFSQQQIRKAFASEITQEFNQDYSENRVLKIGYISSCFGRHSVGYLSRWLLQYHDPEKFEIYGYSLSDRDDFIKNTIADNVTHWRDISPLKNIAEIAKIIRDDQIDILVELDSLTSRIVCGVICLKPAPIQVSWLGFDASELPAIDYFIADQYVLTENAQNYYSEKIWRLPNSYIAVDGFEVDVPSLHRQDLNIPDDAVIYFSSQTGYKRHPDNIKCQMKIIKQVANSYLLIKGLNTDLEAVKAFFEDLAKSEKIDCDRLRFLPSVASEAIHRANLKIADVVLDTYPYNGATTTLETLWMEIPLVTRVGEQFSARNSYTMMINAGITEGIAWSDAEYIEWGIKLGLDQELRKNISWKLKQAKQKSPLWRGKEFAREMENAYRQMWQDYCRGNVS
jgi:predicted O-linked N-acetylglucosamine transferase (SPINDLY family)